MILPMQALLLACTAMLCVGFVPSIHSITSPTYTHDSARRTLHRRQAQPTPTATASVDLLLTQAGGWGAYQKRLEIKLGCTYAFLGVDMMLPAFLIPQLVRDWALTPMQIQLVGSVWFFGALIGFFMSGSVSDNHGRKPILLICSTIRLISTMLLSVAPTFHMVLLSRFISSVASAGAFNNLLPLLFEFAPPPDRAGIKRVMGVAWNVGVLYLSIAAWLLQSYTWQQFCSIIFLPAIPATIWLFSNLLESPKYLLSVNKRKQTIRVISRLAKYNGMPTPPSLNFLPTQTEESPIPGNVLTSYLRLFSPPYLATSSVITILNFVLTLTYYGVAFSDSMGGSNIYSKQIFASLIEIPGLILITPLANVAGRKVASMGLISVFASCLLGLYLSPSPNIRFIMYLIARMTGQAASNLKWLVNAEAYPTSIRNSGLAFAAIAGQLGGLVGPLFLARRNSPLPAFIALLMITTSVLAC